MVNAKQELLNALKASKCIVKCATIRCERHSYWDDDDNYKRSGSIQLIEGYTPAEYEEFLQKLDFEYDAGYGGQELHGLVWLMKENTWLERGEYDGSEWWDYKECPPVPKTLIKEYSQIG